MAKWYVIQVRAGQDDAALSAIGQKVDARVLRRCFSPRYETQAKMQGVWCRVERRLVPGYLIAVTNAPETLDAALREVPCFTRLLRDEKGFIFLDADEVSWLSRFTDGGTRVAPMSTAVKEGDEIIVTEGLLFGNTFTIKRVDRHKSMAYVEVRFLGRTKEVPLGLKIIAKKRTEN